MKKKLKNLLPALPFILTCFGIGAIIGATAAEYALDDADSVFIFVGLLLWMYVAMLLQIIIHEGGHLVFGLASGYKFCSFRIGPVMLIRLNGKLQIKRLSLAGTGGQCLLAPPEPDENGHIPTALYNLGGVLANTITAVVAIVIALIVKGHPIAFDMLMIFAMIGIGFALANGIPMSSLTVANDGANQAALAKKPESAKHFATQMKIADSLSNGLRVREMPSEWFEIPNDRSDPLSATIAVFAANRLVDEGKLTEARELIERLLAEKSGMLGLHRSLLSFDLLSLKLIENPDSDISSELTKENRTLLRQLATQPSAIRTEYLIAKLHEKDDAKAEKLLNRFEKLTKSYPYPQELVSEREIINMVK